METFVLYMRVRPRSCSESRRSEVDLRREFELLFLEEMDLEDMELDLLRRDDLEQLSVSSSPLLSLVGS